MTLDDTDPCSTADRVRGRKQGERGTWWLAGALIVLGLVLLPRSAAEADGGPRRVLFLQSFGAQFSPYMEFATSFRAELTAASPEPIEFFEASLEMSRRWEHEAEGPFIDYLLALFAEQPIDLVVSSGAPAARFCLRQRERLFPDTPLLLAGVQRTLVQPLPPATTSAGTVAFEFPAILEHALALLPETEQVVVVVGASPRSSALVVHMRESFASFESRVRFEWWHELTVDEMLLRAAELPPETLIFYSFLAYDVDGIPREQDLVLTRLHEVASAPIFGAFDTQVGKGVVGGLVISVAEAGQQAAEAALRILEGESPEAIAQEPLRPDHLLFDWRELERWGVDESRLPPGSRVLFREASPWERYRLPILTGLALLGLQSALIAGLVVQRSRRQRAEQEALGLSRRLLGAQEDERRLLAQELHDDYSQRLARLAIDASRLRKTADEETATGLARGIQDELSRLSEDVHSLSYRLHPRVLDDLGLREALQAECEDFERRESIAVEDDIDLPAEMPAETAHCLFRIAQEALRNVAKHARAERVVVTGSSNEDWIRLVVSDEGRGFDPAEAAPHPCLGLSSMRERAHLVGGTLDIESRPGRGTTVTARVPSSKEKSK